MSRGEGGRRNARFDLKRHPLARRWLRRLTLSLATMFVAILAWLHTSIQDFFNVSHDRLAPSVALRSDVPPGRYGLSGHVSHVADGDTLTLRTAHGQRRIRLDSIDAPEGEHGRTQPGQPYAEAATQYLSDLVGHHRLTLQCYETDSYDRDVCAVILPDGTSVNRRVVAAGYAWAYSASRGRYLRDSAMLDLQQKARAARRGLWAQGQAIEPWKWRYDCWKQKHCSTSP